MVVCSVEREVFRIRKREREVERRTKEGEISKP